MQTIALANKGTTHMDSDFRLDGRVALVTGASRGIGLACADALAGAGADVLLVARPSMELYESAVRLREASGRRVEACPLDLHDVDSIALWYETLLEDREPIDILVNAAGMSHRGPAEGLTLDQFTETLTINLTAPFALSQAFARALIAADKPGRIVNIASLMSSATRPGTAPYTASKGGLAMLTKALACDWADKNILVNAVAPGYIHTELTDTLYRDRRFSKWVRQRSLLGRWGEPGDVARPVLFLASPASGFITGQVIYVDGGWTAHL
ncbi:MAG: SDR family oxidoreductase [Phycisphaera sp.]|nr:SDR family oxidoreductase [Phycisphaera sp.]